ncbi:ATP-dependent nuclease [Halomonas heilongjiangensis]|uniref:AAA+ ATPase domain-containing protein n=1 Tax=Halomonas heilongjiangensis TaxID=1387883 RepID=A0A2N7TL56_9GAMM|nr:ATP-binding protein [Halomonas heilongjiangensis]PMR68922.1 hypothetical protein C1H66_13000 [Halomonas heilongjiangensis]PXX87241.1 hypothetical protein CR158_19650 [Halomonas heilongjiangensis]
MIEEIVLKRFKRFRDQAVPLVPDGVYLVAGANNSGKSTILHSLAVWEFCRTIIEAEKGFEAFLPGSNVQGLGLGDDEFSPILVPSLNHLWTNLKSQKEAGDVDGYTLRIRCKWQVEGRVKELEFGLSLANDRMFVKSTFSNLEDGDKVPRVAYLPPFAGITDKESRLPLAIRRRRIGEGVAGSVLRNVLLDLQRLNHKKREKLREGRGKIKDSDLRDLRQSDPWEVLQQTLREIFGVELSIHPFREEYHSYIKVEVIKGSHAGHRINRFPRYKPRDLMVEGSGFLQWLSVYALATDPNISTLLLDEPDAHLHSSLQTLLLEKLEEVSSVTKKQVLVATHSSEILRSSPPEKILEVRQSAPPRFLKNETQKVGLLAGLGSEYSPRMDKVKKNKRLLLVEGEFDCRILKQVADKMGVEWPDRWVEWVSATGHKERRQLFKALKEEVEDLKVVSLRDRDDEPLETVGEGLNDKAHTNPPPGFNCRKWRRRHIECYLLWPPAMAAASRFSVEQINESLRDKYGIAVGEGFKDIAPPQALLDVRGKEILKSFNIDPHKVIPNMDEEEMPQDLKDIVNQLVRLAE